MVSSREVWLRKSNIMNDFSETEHGLACIQEAYNGPIGTKLKELVNNIYPGISDDFEKAFDKWIPNFRLDTYLTCVSEHLPEEDSHGRLSMWRAYGGPTGVALVLNSRPFFRKNEMNAYSLPVFYKNASSFGATFETSVQNLENNQDIVKKLGRPSLMEAMFFMFRLALLCTKHEGFHEEREWRVVYTPEYDRSEILIPDIATIRGIPQLLYKLPLKNNPARGIIDIEIPELLDRIIIGPTEFPQAVAEAFIIRLAQIGVKDSANKVVVSDIPLRQ